MHTANTTVPQTVARLKLPLPSPVPQTFRAVRGLLAGLFVLADAQRRSEEDAQPRRPDDVKRRAGNWGAFEYGLVAFESFNLSVT